MASIIAHNLSNVALSQGTHTNDLFGAHGHVGDIVGCRIKLDTDGYYWSGATYTVPGIAHVAMSLDGVTFGAEGADLAVPGPLLYAGTLIYLKITSVAATAPDLVLTQAGTALLPAAAFTKPVTFGMTIAATAPLSGAFTIPATFGLTINATVLNTPVSGFAASVSGTTVELSWSAFSGADHYQIEWGTDGVTYGNTIDSVSGTTYSHTGRTANTVYYYRIKAHDSGHTPISSPYSTCYAGVQILITVAHSVEWRATSTTWATARAMGGTLAQQGTDNPTELGVNCQLDSPNYLADKAYLDFTTSGGVIPSGVTIDQAWLRLTHTYVGFSSTGSAIYKGSWTNTPAQSGDAASFTASDLGGPTSNPTVNTPTDYAITSPDSNITKNGTAHLVVVDRQKDYANVAPTGVSGNNIGGGGNATTDRRPQLKVSYHG